VTACLSRRTIEDFLSGQTTPRGGSAVETHLAECEGCRKLADQITGDAELSPFVSSHRRAPTASSPPEPSVAMRQKLYSLAERDGDHSSMTDGGLAMIASGEGVAMDGLPRLFADDTERLLGGRYRLRDRVGAGGFGVVYLAEDLQLHRAVALKLPRAPLPHDSVERARFFREANAAAGLHHPQIVALYDAGEMDGVCYLASAYCPGETLATWAERNHGTHPETAAQIVLALAEAIQHAHENGVLHRDIKPQNVLLDPTIQYRSLPFSPKLTDFGIAKLIDGDGTQTATEMMLGTPRYMAPELAAGRRDQLGPACDVYALGVVLYELLTGRAPISGSSHADTLRRVLSDDPVPPRSEAPHVPRDLEAICLTCLEKDPNRRYLSAKRLAEDIERFLQHQPTIARPIPPLERAARWARRRPAAAVAIAASLFFLVGLIAYIRQLATLNRDLNHSNVSLGNALRDTERAKGLAEASDERARQLLYIADMRLAGRAWKAGDLRELTHFLRRHIPKDNEPDRRGFEWHYLWNQSELRSNLIAQLDKAAYGIRLSPDNRLIAVAGQDALVRVYDVNSNTLIRCIETGQREVNGASFSPDGRRIASAGDDGTIRVWRLDDAQNLLTIPAHSSLAFHAVYTPDGTTIVSCGNENVIKFWNAETGAALGEARGGHQRLVDEVAMSQDGRWMASAGTEGLAMLWRTDTREEVRAFRLRANHLETSAVALAPDATFLVTGDNDLAVRLWSVATGRELASGKHLDYIHSVAVSPDGRFIASGDRSGTVQLWQIPEQLPNPVDRDLPVSELQLRRSWRACNGRAYSMQFDRDGERLFTSGADGSVKSWSLPPVGGPRELMPPRQTNDFEFAPGSNLLAVSGDESLRITNLETHEWVWDLPIEGQKFRMIRCDGVGKFVAAVAPSELRIGIWDVKTGELHHTWELSGKFPPSIALAKDGSRLVILDPNTDRVMLWDTASRQIVRTWQAQLGRNSQAMMSPDGRLLVATFDRTIYCFDPSSESVRRILTTHAQGLEDIAFSPTESILATASMDRLVKLWDLRSGEEIATLSGHLAPVVSVCFASQGRSVITACKDGTVKVWNVAGEELFDLYQHAGGFPDVRISPGGRYLAFLNEGDDSLQAIDLSTVQAPR
jgi:WD40 repeat protein/serine/threonine protein kinase